MNAPRSSAAAPGAEQVIADPGQLGDDHPDVLAPRRQLDVQQLLDRMVPGHLVHRRADVVLAVDDRHVLVEVQVLAELLEPRMQVADVGRCLDDPLAVELEDQPQAWCGWPGAAGPKFRVQVACLRVGLELPVRRAIRSTSRHPVSIDFDARGSIQDSPRDQPREVVPFAAAAQGIILPQRIGGELLGHQDPPQVGMPVESDAEHIKNFALHPVGPRPERDGRGERRIGVVRRRTLTTRHSAVIEVPEDVMDLEPGRASGRDNPGSRSLPARQAARSRTRFFEHVNSSIERDGGHEQAQVVAKPRRREDTVAQGTCERGQGRGVRDCRRLGLGGCSCGVWPVVGVSCRFPRAPSAPGLRAGGSRSDPRRRARGHVALSRGRPALLGQVFLALEHLGQTGVPDIVPPFWIFSWMSIRARRICSGRGGQPGM